MILRSHDHNTCYTYRNDPKVARRTCHCGSQNVIRCLKQTCLIVVKYVYFNK